MRNLEQSSAVPHLIGAGKATNGQANPALANKILKEKLDV